MKVLLSAYACEPGRGSEPAAGWAYAQYAAEHHDVWVLTRANNRPAIEGAAGARRGTGPRFVYLDLAAGWRRAKRLPYGTQAYYLAWQRAARRRAEELHAEVGFDLVHHVTFAADWMPAGVLGVGGLPAVWGPVGGATGMPWSLWRWLGPFGVAREAARDAVTWPMRQVFGRRAARASRLVLAQNHDVESAFGRWARTVLVEPNVVAEPPAPESPALERPAAELLGAGTRARADPGGPPRRALFVGRLIPLKGLRLAVAALAQPEAAGRDLDVLGDGPERRPAARLAARLGVAERVAFRGTVPREHVFRALDEADALLAPSLHEAAGFAVAEAVAHGCPVVCLDRGGPTVTVRPPYGLRVPVGGDVVGGLARALAAVGARRPPSDRWSGRRMAGRLAELYALATSGGS